MQNGLVNMNYLLYYVIASYLVGFILFAVEMRKLLKKRQYHLVGLGISLLLLSPLTAWHGVLHYMQLGWARATGRKPKYWI
jgi:hypothetical protein